ncbi:hypothetical protein L596_007596 [Steinernema carpocapsae]|uniref:FIT family protein n=1 Tax=Steinernema carpocapsae TaxID=34508 RepID=A0A4U5P9T3_STECR|nr:hypothetical protein L596_007596 [Steinernema carpocapsae]
MKTAAFQASPTHRRVLAGPTTTSDIISGVTIQLGRRYLFADVLKKVYVYVIGVCILSFISAFGNLPQHFYFMRKDSFFNVYGTKIGWFWTWVAVAPFVYFATLFHTRNPNSAATHLLRLVVATFLWYFFTDTFVSIEQKSGSCSIKHGSLSRADCRLKGGSWNRGFDISGHCFLMIYSILIICEEAVAFRRWPEYAGQGDAESIEDYRKNTNRVRWLFVGMLALHLLWDFQLVWTVLYYHTFLDKILGAFCAAASWFVTYRVIFPVISLSPINRLPEKVPVKKR